MSSGKRPREDVRRKKKESRRNSIAAQRLEHSYTLYLPNKGMLKCACERWNGICISPRDPRKDGSAICHVFRYGEWVIIPAFESGDRIVEKKMRREFEEVIPLDDLKALVKLLDDDDMAAFFQNAVFSTEKQFEEMFTPDFVGTDRRLAFIRDFVNEHGNKTADGCTPYFFDGRTQADKTKVFST
jgi:hypothetical protein